MMMMIPCVRGYFYRNALYKLLTYLLTLLLAMWVKLH